MPAAADVYPPVDQPGINIRIVRGKLPDSETPEGFVRTESGDMLEWRVIYSGESHGLTEPEKYDRIVLGEGEDG